MEVSMKKDCMKNLLLFSFLLVLNSSFGQKQSFKGKADSLTEAKIAIINAFIKITPGDRIADIGTGSGYSLIPIANECPTCKFVVEDIDSSACNKQSLGKRIRASNNQISIDSFEFHYGTEKSTNLPSATFNKVLVFDVIHEMSYRSEMLGDIKRILQKDGSVFIGEILVHKPVKKNKVCNYPFLMENEFKKLMADNNYLIKREAITFDTGRTRYIKIFECVPRENEE
jgi:ubiquinone/menaquinone biosynthesis C-methylase UbiE